MFDSFTEKVFKLSEIIDNIELIIQLNQFHIKHLQVQLMPEFRLG